MERTDAHIVNDGNDAGNDTSSNADDMNGIRALRDLLSNEIKKECSANIINTVRVRILTDELDKFENMIATSISEIHGVHHAYGAHPVRNMGLPVPARLTGDPMFDSLGDIAHMLLKRSEVQTSAGIVDDMIRWLHFLDEVTVDLIDKSIVSSAKELDDIKDSILTAILKNIKTKVKDIIIDGEGSYNNLTMEE